MDLNLRELYQVDPATLRKREELSRQHDAEAAKKAEESKWLKQRKEAIERLAPLTDDISELLLRAQFADKSSPELRELAQFIAHGLTSAEGADFTKYCNLMANSDQRKDVVIDRIRQVMLEVWSDDSVKAKIFSSLGKSSIKTGAINCSSPVWTI